jgi:hypothetical protein
MRVRDSAMTYRSVFVSLGPDSSASRCGLTSRTARVCFKKSASRVEIQGNSYILQNRDRAKDGVVRLETSGQ